MASGEDALRGEISELKEKIANIKEEVIHLRKRRNAYIAKLKLLENHLNAYYVNDGIKIEHGDSSDESFTTSELLELSFSSISSSILGSIASFDDYSNEDESKSDAQRDRHAVI
ncbi:unnamed protein product [Litomosoides sigmodontis]|uniref:Uncharacterized protein n=1 Tax=Litomosoides sigmodontis TaxID=42156 RepID=A0A3P6U0N3_LITSI|nr:unnamed protein product [Litomosoides sigmodontis]